MTIDNVFSISSILLISVLILGPELVDSQVLINVDGGWSPWSTVNTPCNASCGGGVMIKMRSCTNPRPQGMKGMYKDCEGIDKQYFPCNVEPCDMRVSDHKINGITLLNEMLLVV